MALSYIRLQLCPVCSHLFSATTHGPPLPTPTLPFSVGKSPLLTKRWEGCGTNPARGHETNLLQTRSFAPAAYDATRCVGPVALGSQGRRVGQWQNLIGSLPTRGSARGV